MGEHAHCSSIPNPEQAQNPVFSILIDLKTIYHCNYILHKLYTVYTYWLIGRRWSDCWSNNFEEILVFRDSWWINAISPVSYLTVLCYVSARQLTITNITFFKCFSSFDLCEVIHRRISGFGQRTGKKCFRHFPDVAKWTLV